MNTKRTLKWGLVTAAATCAVVAAMPGCELLVDFDRSKIPSEGGTEDVTTPDAPVSEGGGETSTDAPSEASEASMMDAGDAPSETTTTEGGDAHPETGPEGGDASDGATSMAVFAITPASVTYGTVAVGTTTAAYTFTVTNSGNASGTPTVNIGGANASDYASTGCTSAVAPTSTCTLSVTFKPAAAGSRAATIGVGSGTPAAVSGAGAAAGATLTISPTTQSFGSVASGSSSADFSFTVSNTDAANAVTLGAPLIDGQDSTMFLSDNEGGTGQCTGTLAASSTCTIFVHFAPTGTGTNFRYASLSVSGGAAGTASASLTGTGQ
jgi:hypothetical protein